MNKLGKACILFSGLTWVSAETAHLLHLEALQPHTESERYPIPTKPAFTLAASGNRIAAGVGVASGTSFATGVSA